MTTSVTFQALNAAEAPTDLLRALKELKNAVIGNTWKKVEYVGDEALLRFLLGLLVPPAAGDDLSVDLVAETAVIIGALGSAGSLTLRPLLAARVPDKILAVIRALPPSPGQSLHPGARRMLPPLLRALRNVLGATADAVWGHMWGVGAEQKVVGTGLVGEDIITPARVGPKGNVAAWKAEASAALVLVFEPHNYTAILSLLDACPDPVVLLPLYQLLARLIQLPSHREALGLHSAPGAEADAPPFLTSHLLETIANWFVPGRKPNAKLLEAALDLLGALVKGQPRVAAYIREWSATSPIAAGTDDEPTPFPDVAVFVQLLETGPPGVRIAVAGCLTHVLKAIKSSPPRERSIVSLTNVNLTNLNLLSVIVKLLRTEAVEERVKLCFVLAALVSDDERLQKAAAEQGCPSLLMSMLIQVDADETRGELGHDAASRMREAVLLALSALAFNHEPTRSLIADASPPVLPLVCAALSHPSYGVRAAACCLARALSRTVAIVRTSIVDSGVGEEVVATLRREVARRGTVPVDGPIDADGDQSMDVALEEELGDRTWTVEVAATATICNLVTNFSPLKDKLLGNGGLELLVELTASPHEPLALNALWALKNVTYHAGEPLKAEVMAVLGWDTLRRFLSPETPKALRAQALDMLQNLLDDQTPAQMNKTVDALGLEFVINIVADSIRPTADVDLDLCEPGLYILSHLALGSNEIRSEITTRVELLESLSSTLNVPYDEVRIPALRALRHLVESNSRRRPRQPIVDLLQPYQLKTRVQELADSDTSVTVRSGAVSLLQLLERARG
ncbi:hypothetical protein VHUM_01910 [Vanrija humicola]|uniref:Armadillo repeat-containing protein 8 n=1 Tax=Vanrija humicola TaxID=5417 RepID=A0A7D8Z4D1_VANHU|nr:hypothetical protein VHUM_01910 [Vanrija humicola]